MGTEWLWTSSLLIQFPSSLSPTSSVDHHTERKAELFLAHAFTQLLAVHCGPTTGTALCQEEGRGTHRCALQRPLPEAVAWPSQAASAWRKGRLCLIYTEELHRQVNGPGEEHWSSHARIFVSGNISTSLPLSHQMQWQRDFGLETFSASCHSSPAKPGFFGTTIPAIGVTTQRQMGADRVFQSWRQPCLHPLCFS